MAPYAPSGVQYSFGPGPLSPAVKILVYTNVAVFVMTLLAPSAFVLGFGMSPQAVVEGFQVWRLVTYLFVHGGFSHILFNMLALWMFGVELERRWGTVAFTKYYFVAGIGAGVSQLLISLLPLEGAATAYVAPTIGASGAVYGLLMAWAILFPHRQILFMLVFPIPARIFVLIIGAIAFLSALSSSGSSVAHVAHLGGMLFGWLYLKGPGNMRLELKYRLTRWRMERLRRRFDVHKGGRDDDWRDRIH